jgi:hypothetical protein
MLAPRESENRQQQKTLTFSFFFFLHQKKKGCWFGTKEKRKTTRALQLTKVIQLPFRFVGEPLLSLSFCKKKPRLFLWTKKRQMGAVKKS